MLNGRTVAVVVPAYNEETQIGMVIETMPDFVDRIVIVNDKSSDKTAQEVMRRVASAMPSTVSIDWANGPTERTRYNEAEIVLQQMLKSEEAFYTPSEIVNESDTKSRIVLINHLENGGVGASIATGYKWCRDHKIDCTAVMAGDGQMDPAELASLCAPVVESGIDYVKGNRLIHKSARLVIPRVRFFGNSVLSMMTKIASGYWHVSDTQTGYTAVSLRALSSIKLYDIYPRYGMPNDMLVKLNIAYCSLREVEIKPVYRVGEVSKMKIKKVMPKISALLVKCFFQRLYTKYFFRDFHPIFLFYHFAFLLFALCIPLYFEIFYFLMIADIRPNLGTYLAALLCSISGLQSLFFAMWMDMQENERLYR